MSKYLIAQLLDFPVNYEQHTVGHFIPSLTFLLYRIFIHNQLLKQLAILHCVLKVFKCRWVVPTVDSRATFTIDCWVTTCPGTRHQRHMVTRKLHITDPLCNKVKVPSQYKGRLSGHRYFHDKGKRMVKLVYFFNGNFCTGKMTFFYIETVQGHDPVRARSKKP